MKFTAASLLVVIGSAAAFVANTPSNAFGTQLNAWSRKQGNYAPTKASWKQGGGGYSAGGALGTGYNPGAGSSPSYAPAPAPAAPAPSGGGMSLDDLAAQWASRNADSDATGVPAPKAAAPAPAPKAAPAAPSGDQWSNLAAEWGKMNSDV